MSPRREGDGSAAPLALLEARLRSLQELRGALGNEVRILRQGLERAECASRHLLSACEAAEQDRAELAALSVAATRLGEVQSPDQALATVLELLVGLAGAEHAAVLEIEGGRTLLRAATPGLRWTPLEARLLERSNGQSAPVAITSRTSRASTCQPLIYRGRLVGILWLRLVRHKKGLSVTDRALLRLVAATAATALLCARSARLEGWQ